MRSSFALVGIFSALVTACGGNSAGASGPADLGSHSAEASALRFAVTTGRSSTPAAEIATEMLRAELVAAGFNLVVDQNAAHDAEIAIRSTSAEEPSIFVVQVNGKTLTKERVSVTASIRAGGRIVDEASISFVTRGSVEPDDVRPAVARLSSSRRLAGFARQSRAEAVARADQDAERAKAEDETGWGTSRAGACRQPAKLDSCDAVRAYLVARPSGAHAEDARSALKESEAPMARLQKDENYWAQSEVATCKRTRSHEGCTGVELYVAKYGGGLHIDEAHALIAAISAEPTASAD